MADVDEAVFTANALQRHATVVAQESVAEGFGLTVTEAMGRPAPSFASALGGIVDEIVPGVTGELADPRDLSAFGYAVHVLLEDERHTAQTGRADKDRVGREFLGDRHLEQWAHLFEHLS